MKTGFFEQSPGNFSAMRLCVFIITVGVIAVIIMQAVGNVFIDHGIKIDWIRAGAFLTGALACKAYQSSVEHEPTREMPTFMDTSDPPGPLTNLKPPTDVPKPEYIPPALPTRE